MTAILDYIKELGEFDEFAELFDYVNPESYGSIQNSALTDEGYDVGCNICDYVNQGVEDEEEALTDLSEHLKEQHGWEIVEKELKEHFKGIQRSSKSDTHDTRE